MNLVHRHRIAKLNHFKKQNKERKLRKVQLMWMSSINSRKK